MNCDWTKENIVLFIYGELADDAKFALEQHVRQCLGCRRELDAALEFKEGMSALPMKDVSPSFLAANRMQLQESLEHAEQSRSIFSSFVFDAARWFHQIKLAPAMTAALLMIGFAGGIITAHQMRIDKGTGPGPSPTEAAAFDVARIDAVTAQPNNQVSIKYSTLHPQIMNGSTDDPRIRQLLLMGTRNPEIALDSINVLTRRPEDNAVREVLVYALRYDKNVGVRLKSLEALKSYVRDDQRVRDAVVEALVNDNNAGVRQEAIALLDPVKADTSVRSVLTVLSKSDPNKYIREESKRYLASMPHLD